MYYSLKCFECKTLAVIAVIKHCKYNCCLKLQEVVFGAEFSQPLAESCHTGLWTIAAYEFIH